MFSFHFSDRSLLSAGTSYLMRSKVTHSANPRLVTVLCPLTGKGGVGVRDKRTQPTILARALNLLFPVAFLPGDTVPHAPDQNLLYLNPAQCQDSYWESWGVGESHITSRC